MKFAQIIPQWLLQPGFVYRYNEDTKFRYEGILDMTNMASLPLTSPFSSQECRNKSVFWQFSVMMNIITYKTKMPISKLPQLHPEFLNCFHLYWTLRPSITIQPLTIHDLHCPPRSLFDTFGAPNGERRRLSMIPKCGI